jgi:hypothetical protein
MILSSVDAHCSSGMDRLARSCGEVGGDSNIVFGSQGDTTGRLEKENGSEIGGQALNVLVGFIAGDMGGGVQVPWSLATVVALDTSLATIGRTSISFSFGTKASESSRLDIIIAPPSDLSCAIDPSLMHGGIV